MKSQNLKKYVGQELALFSKAVNWKRYIGTVLSPYLGRSILEVGAGVGGTTEILCDGDFDSWVCLEPDSELFSELAAKISKSASMRKCRAVNGTVSDLKTTDVFDTILYVDVLEHIRDHEGELQRAASMLSKGGHLIVLAPAHQSLYSEFDREIGHFRRYSKRDFLTMNLSGLDIVKCAYLDSVGMIASYSNRMFLRQSVPTLSEIIFWDRVMIPFSRIIDPILRNSLGKSLVAIWKKR